MDRIDYTRISNGRTSDEKVQTLLAEVERCGYVCLTDAISNRGHGGDLIMKFLESDHASNVNSGNHRKWKIQVVRDEWGNTPPEIDKVVRRIQKPLKDRVGRSLSNRVAKDMRRRGTFEKEFIELREFPIDEKGCIECCYEDAGWFLEDYGIHFETDAGLCGRREMSGGPCKCPQGGERHVWYWRYKEAPPWVYVNLPVLKKSKKS